MEEEKFCTKCGDPTPISDFHKKRGKPQSVCKKCRKMIHRKHYLLNIHRYKKQAAARKLKIKNLCKELKSHPCVCCNRQFPFVMMEYHHPNKDKLDSINELIYRGNISDILYEIKKCELLCVICHRIKHFTKKQRLEYAEFIIKWIPI